MDKKNPPKEDTRFYQDKIEQLILKTQKLEKLQEEIHFMLDEIAKINGLK